MVIKKSYSKWIYENIEQFKMDNTSYQVTLPFLNIHDEYITIEIRKLDNNNFYINDYGYTLGKLGFDIYKENRINSILSKYKIELRKEDQFNNIICTTCNFKNLIPKINIITQCIIIIETILQS